MNNSHNLPLHSLPQSRHCPQGADLQARRQTHKAEAIGRCPGRAGAPLGRQEARDNMPEALADGAYATKLDKVLALREHVEALIAADLPLAFGRD